MGRMCYAIGAVWIFQVIYNLPLDPKTHGKMKVWGPKIWVITPRNGGCGFSWYLIFFCYSTALRHASPCSVLCWSKEDISMKARSTANPSGHMFDSYLRPSPYGLILFCDYVAFMWNYLMKKSTPLKFNMEPEKKSLEKEAPPGNHHFQVPC